MWKSHSQKKENLSKELEHERILRMEAEQRLHEITQESDNCRSHLHALQDEFKKMEEMVQNMQQYKTKIDQLKQEKSSLSVTYENNLQKFGSHISDLERENMMLLNEVKKLESQINNKTTDGRDKSKLLLERLRMLEKENSSLVLENEQQRQQYEKCLDEIANQVVQALLAQKMLREECMKLQNRVHDLELQNRQLSILFQQRIKLTSESANQHTLKSDESGEHSIYIQGSIESLQSIFSEQMSENLASMPQMSTPPPWLQERLSLCGDQFSAGDRLSIISLPGSIQSNPDLNTSKTEHDELCCRTMIETEFPATPSSPKVKHINVFERKKETKRSSSTSSLAIPSRSSKVRTRSTSSLSRARGLSLSPQGVPPSELISGSPTLTSSNQGNTESGQLGDQSEIVNRQETISRTNSQEKVSVSRLPVNVSASKQNHAASVPSQAHHTTSRIPTTGPLSVNQSPSPTRKQGPQGPNTRQTSKLPVFGSQTSQNKEQSQTRRNSKGETGIRMGCQSPVSRTLSTNSDIKQTKTGTPPAVSGQSSTTNSVSRIPSSGKSAPKSQKPTRPTSKEKGNLNRQNSGSSSKLATPGSSQVKQSGIKTTLKTETKVSSTPVLTTSSANVSSVVSSVTLTLSANTASSANDKTSAGVILSTAKGRDVKSIPRALNVSTMPKWHHEGPYANPRPETHFPRMGTTNLTHPVHAVHPSQKVESGTLNAESVKATEVPKSALAKADLPDVKTDILTPSSIQLGNVSNTNLGNMNNTQLGSLSKGQYFYDYSDEDSDWNRPVSKDYSIASSVSLDEMLDKTLENIDITPADTDFSSDTHFIFKSPVLSSSGSPELDISGVNDNGNVPNGSNDISTSANNKSKEINENDDRLRGKPDIVKDTEECEQRNMKKSLTASQIPGSGMAGYRARRPKSLILGSKDKKFVYAEYGSSSSLDSTSDEDWSYQFSYAKNIKQQEIQTKVAKSLQSGDAKEIGTPTNISTLEVALNSGNDKNGKNSKNASQLPHPNSIKKPVKTPPPIAQKPVRKRSPSNSDKVERPKSVEICVNTALAPMITKPVTNFFPFHETIDILNEKDLNRFTSEKFSTLPQAKTENIDKKLDTSDSFDEVTVERSGSRDDGYSTMSSDVQPDAMEKYSDENLKEKHPYVCEGEKIVKTDSDFMRRSSFDFDTSIQNQNRRNSGHFDFNLGSPTSVSSGDRHSQCGSLGRVRAMKMKYELEIQNRSPEKEINPLKSPPPTPPKSPKKPVQENSSLKNPSKIPLVRQSNISSGTAKQLNSVQSKIAVAVHSKIPVSQTVNEPNKTPVISQMSDSQVTTNTVDAQTKKSLVKTNNDTSADDYQTKTSEKLNIPLRTIPVSLNYAKPVTLSQDNKNNNDNLNDLIESQNIFSSAGVGKPQMQAASQDPLKSLSIHEQFSQLSYFMPPSDTVSFREGGGDSSSSTSDRGSDLTSLHISEDNILSDIPEEKEGYESSVGKLSEANSLASIPLKDYEKTKTVHTCCQHQKVHFEVRIRKIWSSDEGLMRAVKEGDINQQSNNFEVSLFDDVYGGSLNMETPLDRSASESDINKKGDNPEKRWLPRLARSRKALSMDELTIEGRVNDILKQMMFQQFSKTAESADSDDKSFSNFVEMLIQKGHVLDTSSSFPNMETSLNSRVSISCSSITSSKGDYSNQNFEADDRLSRESSCGPVGEEQKQFNSNFYSLCNVGSNQSISENCEAKTDDKNPKQLNGNADVRHDCDKLGEDCKKCLEEKNAKEFDEISRQIESLSKTVNELHQSLTSLNSENNDSEHESNEGDHSSLFSSAIGNKEIDGYQWLEDEFFLSPYGGEIILGTSPFSDTGASCDWMNDYMDDGSHFDEAFGEREAMHEKTLGVSEVEMNKRSKSKLNFSKTDKSSILAGLMDDEGNFDSQEYISQRLKQEEQKLGSVGEGGEFEPQQNIDLDVNAIKRRHGVKPILKEELRTTPERDVDTTSTDFLKMAGEHLGLGRDHLSLSQDSLDDNIGVDNVMCHRFIGKGERPASQNRPGCRPALDFSSQFFSRYGDLEKEAVAAFDFLDDIPTSVASPGSYPEAEKRKSHDICSSDSIFQTSSDFLKKGSSNVKQQIFSNRHGTGSHDSQSHDRLTHVKVDRKMSHGVAMDQSVSSTDSYMTPVKKSRRKPRSKIKKGDQSNGKRPLRKVSKFSSTSADESNDDDLSFSDSCCYHSFSSSSSSTESLVDKV